jgi:hypothetical protein
VVIFQGTAVVSVPEMVFHLEDDRHETDGTARELDLLVLDPVMILPAQKKILEYHHTASRRDLR